MGAEGFGERLQKARRRLAHEENRNVTQAEVGTALGVTSAAVGAWENGDKEPRLTTIEQLAAYLRVPPGELAFGEGYDKVAALPEKPSQPREVRSDDPKRYVSVPRPKAAKTARRRGA